jgi:hypothetical protein
MMIYTQQNKAASQKWFATADDGPTTFVVDMMWSVAWLRGKAPVDWPCCRSGMLS